MKLTATWSKGKELFVDLPNSIKWEDGRKGTLDDLRVHSRNTYTFVDMPNGDQRMLMFPEIVAEVYFCQYGKCWGIRGTDVEPIALPITDPNATDQQLQHALFSLPMKYRVNIVR